VRNTADQATVPPAGASAGSARQFTTDTSSSAPAAANATAAAAATRTSLPPFLSDPSPAAAARLSLEQLMQAEWLRQQLDAIEIGAKPGSDTQPEQVLEVKHTQTLHTRPRAVRCA